MGGRGACQPRQRSVRMPAVPGVGVGVHVDMAGIVRVEAVTAVVYELGGRVSATSRGSGGRSGSSGRHAQRLHCRLSSLLALLALLHYGVSKPSH